MINSDERVISLLTKEFIVLMSTVFSYIDPMSGAIILQVAIAGIIGCIAFFRRSVWAVVSTVFRIKHADEDSSK